MGFIKGILMLIGTLVVAGLIFAFVKFGGTIGQVSKLDPQAMGLYMNMFGKVLETGDSAEAMIRKVKVLPEVSNEDIKDAIESIANDGNMEMVGDVTMFDGAPMRENGPKTRYTRIFSLCSRPIADQFLSHSMAYGAFMPCRIMLQEDKEGNRWLHTMDMGLMLHGGAPLSGEMLKMAEQVRDTVYRAMDDASQGEF